MTTPRAFDITPLTVNAPSRSMRGPRTPFSPEREHTFVSPPEVNPERHAQLAGAMEERRGATIAFAKEVMFYQALVCLSSHLSGCQQLHIKTTNRSFMKTLPEMYLWTKKDWLNCEKSPTSESGSRKFWRILQHCDIWL